MLTFALGSLAKGTLLLLLGVLADRLLRRRGPDVRHAALAVALLGALLIPVLSVVLPSWRAQVPWLPPAPIVGAEPNETPPLSTLQAHPVAAVAPANRVVSAGQDMAAVDVALVGILVWGVGALCVVIVLLCGELAMLRVRRRAHVAVSASWKRRLRQTAAEVDAPPNVAVLISADITVPLTCGLLRPAVLLPADAEHWTDERKRVVLVHELSHVRRHDAAMELAVWLACAVYWFHPLVWFVARQLRLQRELACDDSVVRTTGDSLGYARQLVDIAAAARVPSTRGFAALAMAARGTLEVRVRSLLRMQRSGRASAAALVRLCLLGAAAVLALSVLQPIRAASRPVTEVPGDTLRLWPGASALGKRLSVHAPPDRPEWGEVVGVVTDIKQMSLDAPAQIELYEPHAQVGDGTMALVIRTRDGALAPVISAVRGVVRAMDPNLPLYSIKTMDEHLGESIATRRFSAMLLSAFSIFAVIVAALGLYGVIAYSVAQRTRELGVRVALGAQRASIARLVLRSGLTVAGVGVLIGVALALSLTRLLAALLYGVGSFDPMSYAAVAATLMALAALASWIPARRATRVDPVQALRGD